MSASPREHRLEEGLKLAIEALEALVHPDPKRGILTYLKQQGDVPVTQTHDAVLEVILALKQKLLVDVERPMPERIGLCPVHRDEFWYPLRAGESLRCPECDRRMTVYAVPESWNLPAEADDV